VTVGWGSCLSTCAIVWSTDGLITSSSGFFPKPLLDVINPAVDHTMAQVGKSDPTPTVTKGEAAQK